MSSLASHILQMRPILSEHGYLYRFSEQFLQTFLVQNSQLLPLKLAAVGLPTGDTDDAKLRIDVLGVDGATTTLPPSIYLGVLGDVFMLFSGALQELQSQPPT